MRIVLKVLLLFSLFAAAAVDARAQQFQPPKNGKHGGTRIGLFGFGVRGGVDFRRSGQLVLGTTLDLGDLFSNRLRLRPSAEVGVFNGANTYVGNFEVLWRFTDDEEVATPYIGGGVGVAGRDGCGTDPQCPDLWVNTVFGFELHWMIVYFALSMIFAFALRKRFNVTL